MGMIGYQEIVLVFLSLILFIAFFYVLYKVFQFIDIFLKERRKISK
ncbi:hypothetical protein [Methanooceanicella nereidis]|nr:hypothetical protein [Methanocella sp. CWC-04]